MQNRLRSWPLWVALAALVTFVVKEIWNVDINDKVNAFMDLLLPALVAFGVVNNPKDPDHF